MKRRSQQLIAEVSRSSSRVGMTIGIDPGDVWSHYCTLNEDGEVVDRGRFRTTPSGVEKWLTDLPRARIAMETGTHSIWISEQLRDLGHEVIVANVRELRAISHSDRKSDQVDAEKIARYARLDPKILRPISHRTVAQQQALTLIRARNLIVRLRTAAGQSEHSAVGDGHADTITGPKITSQIDPGKYESNHKRRHYLLLKNFTRSSADDRKEGAWSSEVHHENDQVADVDAIH